MTSDVHFMLSSFRLFVEVEGVMGRERGDERRCSSLRGWQR